MSKPNQRLQVVTFLYGEHKSGFISLKQRTKIHGSADLVRYLITLVGILYQHKKDGGKILLEDKDGKRKPLILL